MSKKTDTPPELIPDPTPTSKADPIVLIPEPPAKTASKKDDLLFSLDDVEKIVEKHTGELKKLLEGKTPIPVIDPASSPVVPPRDKDLIEQLGDLF